MPWMLAWTILLVSSGPIFEFPPISGDMVEKTPFHHLSFPHTSARNWISKIRLYSTKSIPQAVIPTKFQAYAIFGVGCKGEGGGIIF